MTNTQRMIILKYSLPTPPTPEVKAELRHRLKKLPEGFGPDHRDWNIPSRRNKWLQVQGMTFNAPKFTTPNKTDERPVVDRKRVKR